MYIRIYVVSCGITLFVVEQTTLLFLDDIDDLARLTWHGQ